MLGKNNPDLFQGKQNTKIGMDYKRILAFHPDRYETQSQSNRLFPIVDGADHRTARDVELALV